MCDADISGPSMSPAQVDIVPRDIVGPSSLHLEGSIYIIKIIMFIILYDVAVIQWITSCHKNRMTTRYIKFWRVHVTS